MRKIVAVGGAPSSGTTLLADLLDSIPNFACPPELYVLCFEGAYRFDQPFKQAALSGQLIETGAPYGSRHHWFNRKYLPLLGISPSELGAMLDQADSLPAFLDSLGSKFEQEQQRSVGVICEKTPVNINWADRFCTQFPQAAFIHVVRSGPAVIQSLIRRGYSFYEATLIWLHQTAIGLEARRHGNYIEIRYEDLLQRPFEVASKLADDLGAGASPAEIEAGFRNNRFRSGLPRPASWTAAQFRGEIVTPAAAVLSPEQSAFLSDVRLWRAGSNGADPITSFADLMKALGYGIELNSSGVSAHVDFLSEYVRYGRNLDTQSALFLASEAGVAQALAQRTDVAFGEIIRLRRKFKKRVGGPQ